MSEVFENPQAANRNCLEARFAALADRSGDAQLVVVNSAILYANPAAARMLRCDDRSQLVELKLSGFICETDRPAVGTTIEAAANGDHPSAISCHLHRPNEDITTVSFHAAPITWGGENGALLSLSAPSSVSTSHSPEHAFEARFRALLDATSDITFRLSAQGNQVLELAGRVFESPQPVRFQDAWFAGYIEPSDQKRVVAAAVSALATEKPAQIEHRIHRPDGQWLWVLSRIIPVRDTTGTIMEWLGSVTDISEYKQAQEAATAATSLDRYRAALADALRSFTTAADLQSEAARVLGDHLGADRVCYTDVSDTGEVDGRGGGGAYPGGIDPAILEHCLKGQTKVVADVAADPWLSATQKKKWLSLGIQAQVTVPWRKEERLLGLMTVYQLRPRAWTETEIHLMEETVERIGAAMGRARTEALLRTSEERYRSLFNAIDAGFCVIEVLLDNPDGVLDYRFLEVNRSFERHTGIKNPLGRTMRSIAPDLEEHWFEAYAQVARSGDARRFEHPAAALGGKWFDAYAFRVGRPEEYKVGIIFNDVTQRRRLEQVQSELLDREHSARRVAEAATRAKDDFLAMLSHELRTPLNPILMLASEAAGDTSLPENMRAQFATIRRNVELEARLIDDLLDVTRITRGKMVLELQNADVHQSLNEALRTVAPEIEVKELELSVKFSATVTRVLADPVRLQQIFWNVLRNAAKFTPVGGRVWVETSNLRDRIQIRVTDTGIGMGPNELNLAFEPFVQGRHVSETGAHQFGGLGLGLAISRKLAEMHEGSIAASSEGVGQGCTFTIDLPVQNAVAQPASPRAPSAPALRRPSAGTLRILIVEDHEPTRNSLKYLLERRRHEVSVAGTVAEGLAALSDRQFDLLLSDLGLPDGDGRVLAESLRELQPQASAIALSGYGRDDDLARSAEAGFKGHLVKPIAIEKLDLAITAALSGEST